MGKWSVSKCSDKLSTGVSILWVGGVFVPESGCALHHQVTGLMEEKVSVLDTRLCLCQWSQDKVDALLMDN